MTVEVGDTFVLAKNNLHGVVTQVDDVGFDVQWRGVESGAAWAGHYRYTALVWMFATFAYNGGEDFL